MIFQAFGGRVEFRPDILGAQPESDCIVGFRVGRRTGREGGVKDGRGGRGRDTSYLQTDHGHSATESQTATR